MLYTRVQENQNNEGDKKEELADFGDAYEESARWNSAANQGLVGEWAFDVVVDPRYRLQHVEERLFCTRREVCSNRLTRLSNFPTQVRVGLSLEFDLIFVRVGLTLELGLISTTSCIQSV